jgi:hypothetical protein
MMRKAKEATMAAIISWALSPMLMASPPNLSDEQIIDSMQTVQLIPNTQTYGMWAHWVREQIAKDAANYHDFRNGQFVPKVISRDVDLITIRTAFHVSDVENMPSRHAATPSGQTPALLPISGSPGEHITIVSQTAATYLSWTYTWKQDANGGQGGWQLTANAFQDCQYLPNRPTGFHCDRPTAPAG